MEVLYLLCKYINLANKKLQYIEPSLVSHVKITKFNTREDVIFAFSCLFKLNNSVWKHRSQVEDHILATLPLLLHLFLDLIRVLSKDFSL